jgi:quercetin dioxygenase-like cupin family protein
MQKLSLIAIARDQLAAAARSTAARASTTVFGGHEHALRQTVLALQAGAVLAEHENPGEATLYVLSGRVELTTAADSWQGRQGDLIIIPEAIHGLRALEESAVLLTAVPRAHIRGSSD